jgi:hypothetical protein
MIQDKLKKSDPPPGAFAQEVAHEQPTAFL